MSTVIEIGQAGSNGAKDRYAGRGVGLDKSAGIGAEGVYIEVELLAYIHTIIDTTR